ncbi:MAG: riboflavin biosynthesis protein RibF [Candidatus Omnitrophota bacterium]
MKIIEGTKGIKIRRSVVTIGVFDGVHVGHVSVIRKTVARAAKMGIPSVAVTFDPHPAKVLSGRHSAPSIMSLAHRIRLICRLGVDYVVIMKFTKGLAGISPGRFAGEILRSGLGTREIYIGEDFSFGRGGSGTVSTLKFLGRDLGFMVRAVRPVRRYGRVVSSSFIRDLIIKGDLARASVLLARPVSILGTVVSGLGKGRILGFPTANIDPHHEAVPPYGVYAVRVNYGGKMFGGILNIGLRPAFFDPGPEREPTIEVHIFGFNKMIYGEEIEILFVRKMRDELKFRDKASLTARIMRDAAQARKILGFTK